MNSTHVKNRSMLITSMCIFGTIGILRRYIPLSSSLVALVRGVIGSVFLLIVCLLTRRTLDKTAMKKNLFLPGVTTKKEDGHGMGLYIADKIIREAGGKLQFTSTEESTVFHIMIPKAQMGQG